MILNSCDQKQYKEEHQLTNDLSYNHDLDNNDNFSPDDQWLVYDTRTVEGGIGTNGKIEKVKVETGEKKVLYQLNQNTVYGPGVGAVSYSHTDNEVVFIHGLKNCSPNQPYEQWRRTGVIVNDNTPNLPIFMDARDTSIPFTPGALRGGTHRHEFSGDGQWIGYTYNDALMKKMEDKTGLPYNLRTIGVSKKNITVAVSQTNTGEDFSGEWFSALVVTVVPDPLPGSDQINKATGDSWVGHSGYQKINGDLQRARAFIGTVKNTKGVAVDEVFIVDIPADISIAGIGPLEGTATTMPSPPKGAQQRRLTFTAKRDFPGCEGIVRSSFDGSLLGFVAKDNQNIKQVFTLSPIGGTPLQQTFHATNVMGGIRWHPKKNSLIYIWDNALVLLKIGDKKGEIITKPSTNPPTNPVWSHNGEKIAFNRSISNKSGHPMKQIFTVNF
ncbi:Tol-Pal system protein TolB [Arenibacter antarcticus]|uniref:DUF3748 domain-containing protein n=1 Tax=Arenibacter antarcticus TaxID=2040469 RepID=A0ABW5VEB0_9FLAO|nr:DUF3748 domain-containing protein [Arenibacter sp. H213]